MKNPFPENMRRAALISPASAPRKEDVLLFKKEAKELLGIEISIMPSAMSRESRNPLKQASEEERLEDMHSALRNPKIDMIICSRGGYGSIQLLDKIDWNLFRKRQLPILGYSDITALHLAIFAKKAGIAIASPGGTEMMKSLKYRIVRETLEKTFPRNIKEDSEEKDCRIPGTKTVISRKGEAEGPVLPVNMTVLCSLIGTPYLPDFNGKMLLLEDINEHPYKIDRMFNQLLLSGIARKCSAILLGNFRLPRKSPDIRPIFVKFAERVSCPVVSGIPFGHIREKICLRYGQTVRITKDGHMLIRMKKKGAHP